MDPYDLCMDFVLERFGKFFLPAHSASGAIVLESRGFKEDKQLLSHFLSRLSRGTAYATASDLRYIQGVYFNPKWALEMNDRPSYFGLELADVSSFPLHKYARSGVKDPAFAVIEPKLYGFPRYSGRGIKMFP